MTKQEKLIKELKELEMGVGISKVYCDIEYFIYHALAPNKYTVAIDDVDADGEDTIDKYFKNEIEVVEHIYGEYKENKMTTPQEVKAHLIEELKEEKSNLKGLLEDLQEAAAFYEKEWKKVLDTRYKMGTQYRNEHITLEEYESRDKQLTVEYLKVRKEAFRIWEEEMESIYNEY